ncbi:MAG: PAS domain-containing protein, partial [Nitrospirota bacterium]|nr:PAS domain-containing protein [Nitrospirota bacterium]
VSHYEISKAGVWVDCIHQRKPVIHNDYESLTHKKGLPPGHAEVLRELVVPVFRGDKITAILGVGNKQSEYTEQDIIYVSILADLAWDITECKRSEEKLSSVTQRLKLAAQSARLGIWDWDIVNNTMVWDDRMLELYGYTSETFPGSIEAWQNGLYPEDRDKSIAEFQAALRGEKEWDADFRVLHPDGTVRQIKANGIVIRDSKGAPVRMLGVNFDITEHRQLEAQLRQSQKMESVGTLAGGIAHDFNNMLSAIIGYGSLSLMKMAEDDPNRLNIQYILEASEKAAHLTKDLLLFSRKQAIDRKPLDLNETIRRLQKFLIRVIGEDIICNTRFSEEKLMISADSHQFEQVLINLTTNARDAMPKGGAFTITTEEVNLDEEFTSPRGLSKPGRYALISISDTGHGMDKETREKIFEPFFTTKEVGKGTGLGLAVVYGIIKQHD